MDYPSELESVYIKNPDGNWDVGYIKNGIWYIGVDDQLADIVCPYEILEWKHL